MIREVYHPRFADDLRFLAQTLGKKRWNEFVFQLNRAIEQVLRDPYRAAALKYAPLKGFRKKKFFSVRRPSRNQRPDMRLIYRYVPKEKTIYFLAVAFRIAQRPSNPQDVYQRAKRRDLNNWRDVNP
jgi:hypothetical protein